MKSFIKGGIGKVITDYGTKVMDIAKKGNLGRSLFSFIGSLRADSIQFPELPAPGTPATDKGGVIYVKDDGKPYFKSSTTSETDLTQGGGGGGVTSLEGLNGALDLTAGNNISISDNGSDAITIGVTGVVTETTTHIHEQVKNVEGSTIPAGTPVYAIDEVGNSGKVRIGKADASNAAKMPAIGILDTQLVNNAEGTATLIGIFNTNLSGFTGLDEGDIVYVASGGGLTATKPTGSGNLIQNMGIILKTNGTNIQGFQVTCIGRTNDVPNLDNGHVFIGDANNQAVATAFSTLLPTQSLAAITTDSAGNSRMIVKGSALDDASGSAPSDPNTTGSVHTILKGTGWFHTEDVGDRNDVNSLPLNIYTGHGQGTAFDSSGDATLNNSTDVSSGSLTLQSGDLKNTGSGDTDTGTISIVSGETINNGSGSHTSGHILISAGLASGTGDCTAGNITIEQGYASSTSGTTTHGTLKLGNTNVTTPVEVLNKLKVKSNVIQDEDGVDCITFDSSGNTTIANTLNATLTGNVTGNTSGSSGSCTGNAATATALTTGNKDITGTLNLKASTATGNPLLTFSQTTTRRAFIQLADNNAGFENHLRIASEYGPVSIAAASTAGSDTDTVFFMVEPTGIFKFGAVDSDAVLTTDGNMTFRIDADNDETSQKFAFQNNTGTEIASLSESGVLDLEGVIRPDITYIKILPRDFIADDVGRPAQIDDTGSGRWLESHSTAKLYASVDIPPGFKATAVDIYGSGTSNMTVYEANINSSSPTSLGNGSIGTTFTISSGLQSNDTNYLLIELSQTSLEKVYGGKVTIAKI